MFNDDKIEPRHLSTGKCLCQFIEEHFRYDELDLNESGIVSKDYDDSGVSTQSQAIAKVEANGEQEAEGDYAGVDRQSKEFAAMQARSAIVNMPNGKLEQLDAAWDLATSLESRKITPLGALVHKNGHANKISSGQQLDMLVPTLSHLVDMKDRQEQFKISMDIGFSQESAAQQQQHANSNCYASKLIDGFTTHLQQERLDSTSSPTTEQSFDLTDAGDLLPSSSNYSTDELMKRLKSLLESRKNEFSRGLVDGNQATNITSQYNSNSTTNNFLTYSGRSPLMTGSSIDKSIRSQDSNGGSTQTVNQTDETISGSGGGSGSSGGSRIGQLGKKFFSQTDGLFFLGTKKNQQGVYAKQQQVLEIC